MNRVFVSDHSLSALARCEQQHALKWSRWEAKDEAVALVCGRAIHDALELWRKGGSAADALAAFETSYGDFAREHVPADDKREASNVRTILAEYMRRRPLASAPWDAVVSVEAGYAAPLATVDDTEYWYVCFPDMVVRRDARLHTVDTKHTGWLSSDWTNQWEHSTQLTGQQWTVEQVFGERCADSFVDGIEVKTLNSSAKKCSKHGTPYHECALEHLTFKHVLTHREPWQVTDWVQMTGRLVGRLHHLHAATAKGHQPTLDGIYTGACSAYGRMCDYWGWCSTGRQVEMLPQMFERSGFQLRDRGIVLGPGKVPIEIPVREAA